MRRQYRITVSNHSCPLDDWPDDTNHPSTPSSVGKSLTAPQINISLLPVPNVSLWTHHLTQIREMEAISILQAMQTKTQILQM